MDRPASEMASDQCFKCRARLDRGEREAIQLAVERKAEVLIIDEWKGRTMHGAAGALGVLGDALQPRLIDDPLEILAEMRRHGFRIDDQLAARFRVLLGTRYAR